MSEDSMEASQRAADDSDDDSDDLESFGTADFSNADYFDRTAKRLESAGPMERVCHGSVMRLETETVRSQNELRVFLRKGNAFLDWDLRQLAFTTVLDLTFTKQTCIPEGLERLWLLRKLTLRQNELTALPEAAFATMVQLEELDLSRNCISDVPSAAFKNLSKLEKLDLSCNCVESLYDDMFVGVPSLLNLDLSKNKIDTVHQHALRGLGELDLLDLSGNHLGSIHVDALEGLGNITTFTLNKNDLRFMPGGLFRGCEMMHSMSLSMSSFGEGMLSADTFAGLKSLARLDLSTCNIRNLPPNLFKPLSALVTLDVSFNKIERLNPEATSGLGNLQTLIVSHNLLKAVAAGTFQNSRSLTLLDLSSNFLTDFPGSLVAHLDILATLDLSSNFVSKMPSLPKSVKAMRRLNMSHNQMQQVPYDSFENCKSVDWCNISNNRLSSYEALKEPFFGMHKVKNFDLSRNEFSTLPPESFKAMTELRTVDLSHNAFASMPTFQKGKNGNVPKVNNRGNRCSGFVDVFGRATERDYAKEAHPPPPPSPVREAGSGGSLTTAKPDSEEASSLGGHDSPSSADARGKVGKGTTRNPKRASLGGTKPLRSSPDKTADGKGTPAPKHGGARKGTSKLAKARAALEAQAQLEEPDDEGGKAAEIAAELERLRVFQQPMTVLVGAQLEF